LVKRQEHAAGDDQTARFYRLVWPERAAVLRLARILCHNDFDADELAQETMIRAFRSLDSFQEGTSIRSWLAAILRHLRIDRLRSQALHSAVSLEQSAIDPPDEKLRPEPDWIEPQAILQSFSDQEVIDALRRLPEDIRWTLLLVDVEEMDHADAAGILSVPVGTIKSRAHRGRAMLREALLPLARQRRLVGDSPQTETEAIP
jgi:RNA polymerase sigma-70 factor (ECF subfamily)